MVSFVHKTLRGLAPTRYKYPAKTIGYSQFYFLFLLLFRYYSIFLFTPLIGLRGNAPIISLGGNSITMNGYELFLMIGLIEYMSYIIDVRLWVCNDKSRMYDSYTMMKSTIYGILSEGVVWWPKGLERGGWKWDRGHLINYAFTWVLYSPKPKIM